MRPDLYKDFNPWDRLSNVRELEAILTQAGVQNISIQTENATHPIQTPEDWWTLLMGSGSRGLLDQLAPSQLARVKLLNLSRLQAESVSHIEANVIYALGVKTQD